MLKHTLRLVLLMSAALALGGCGNDGTAERAGENVEEAVEETKEAIEDASEQAGEKMEEAGDRIEKKTEQ